MRFFQKFSPLWHILRKSAPTKAERWERQFYEKRQQRELAKKKGANKG
jgi:hypothetical protein